MDLVSVSLDQGVATAHRKWGKVPTVINNVYNIQQDCTTQNWGEEDTGGWAVMTALLWRRRYELVGLTKHRDHTRARVCSWHLSSNVKRLVPSMSHRGILSRQGYTPMKAVHPFNCTPVQLHTHNAAHSFSFTPVVKVLHCSCQNVTRLTVLTVNPNWPNFFLRKREKAKAFSFSI